MKIMVQCISVRTPNLSTTSIPLTFNSTYFGYSLVTMRTPKLLRVRVENNVAMHLILTYFGYMSTTVDVEYSCLSLLVQ